MKKRCVAFITILVLFTGVLFVVWRIPGLFLNNQKAEFDEIHHHFPKDFNSCGYIVYNVEGAPPLKINDDRKMHHYFDKEGVAVTSSPQKFGWYNENTSGSYKGYYHVGGELLPLEHNVANSVGESELQEGGYIEYEIHAFNDSQDCHGDMFEELIKKYKDRLTTK